MLLWIAGLILAAAAAPSSAETVTCTLSRDGTVIDFEGNQKQVSGKAILAEWNPGQDDCKFEMAAKFNGGYQYTLFSLGPHPSDKKFFRIVNFDKYKGQVGQQGYRCKKGCRGPITSFDVDIFAKYSGTYGTVKEVEPGKTYAVESDLCSADKKPHYKMVYQFDAGDNEPVATLELDKKFYRCKKLVMSGACIGSS